MSSYSGTAPVGDPKATGAYAVAIAAQAGGTNNDGHATDSAGNLVVDFVWGGQLPLQPNDERRATAVNIGGTNGSDAVQVNANYEMRDVPGKGADAYWSATTAVTGGNLSYGSISAYSGSNAIANRNVPSDNHVRAETAWSGYPSYTPAQGNAMITAASSNGTTVSYTALNWFNVGDVVNITGLTTSAFNLSSATIASATRWGFTVTNGATGAAVTGALGKAEYATALTASDGAYIAGVDYLVVPNVLGLTTALATDAMNDAEMVPTTASAATNTATQPTRINVTSTTAATVYVSGGTGTWAVGTKVTIASGTGIPAALVGTWSVTGGDSSTLVIAGSGWTVADTGSITPGTKLTGASGTIKAQSVAANAASISAGTAVTITPWA